MATPPQVTQTPEPTVTVTQTPEPTVTVTQTPEPTPTVTVTAAPPPRRPGGGYTECLTGIFANANTSCEFASSVADRWARSSGAYYLEDVYSPVTGLYYDMTCSGRDPVSCRGGNNAEVLIYY